MKLPNADQISGASQALQEFGELAMKHPDIETTGAMSLAALHDVFCQVQEKIEAEADALLIEVEGKNPIIERRFPIPEDLKFFSN